MTKPLNLYLISNKVYLHRFAAGNRIKTSRAFAIKIFATASFETDRGRQSITFNSGECGAEGPAEDVVFVRVFIFAKFSHVTTSEYLAPKCIAAIASARPLTRQFCFYGCVQAPTVRQP